MLRKGVLILLLFIVLIFGGCTTPEPTLQDELREIDSDLQWAMVSLQSALELSEKLKKELHLVNEWEWDCEDLGIVNDTVFGTETMADELSSRLKEIVEDVGNAQYRLSDIRPR